MRILRSIPDVENVRRQFRRDDRIVFTFRGREAAVHEPFGDNSRYWVGLQEPDHWPEVDIWPLHKAFSNYSGVVSHVWIWNFFNPVDTNLEFEYLVRPFLAQRSEIPNEWKKVSSGWWGGRTDLVCTAREPSGVYATLSRNQITIGTINQDRDFESFGRQMTEGQVAKEAFDYFVALLHQSGIAS